MMLLFVLLVMADFFISLKVGIEIGYLASVVWIVSSAIVGIVLLRLSPYALISNFQSFNFGEFDIRDVHNASMAYLLGAVLLIVPGVLSDFAGIALLAYTLYLHLFAKMRHNERKDREKFEGVDNVIDVEIVDEFDSCHLDSRGK
jgi:UPF0716 family protein affecting phage T7 exclusion